MIATSVDRDAATAIPGVGNITLAFHSLGEVALPDRLAAAHAAGFRNIGLSARRLLSWLEDGHELHELRELLDRYEIAVTELEVVVALGSEPDPIEADALVVARQLGATYLQTVAPELPESAIAGQRFAALCDRAADHGLHVGLEFLPWSGVPDVQVAHRVVADAGRDNGGVCVDIWHLYRSGGTPDDLRGMWPQVVAVQVNDGPLEAEDPDLERDCRERRRPPGDGDFDLDGLLRAAAASPRWRSWSMEVLSRELRSLSATEVAARLARAWEPFTGRPEASA
jgi:sugar phosphate isomerase/epimerase